MQNCRATRHPSTLTLVVTLSMVAIPLLAHAEGDETPVGTSSVDDSGTPTLAAARFDTRWVRPHRSPRTRRRRDPVAWRSTPGANPSPNTAFGSPGCSLSANAEPNR